MFSERNRYILKLLLHLAVVDTDEYRTVEELSKETHTPADYMAKVVGFLSRKGYLDTKKGRNGGIRLADRPNEVLISKLLNDIDALDHESEGDACCVPEYLERCVVNDWIDGFKQDVLGRTTLQDLVDAQEFEPTAITS